MIKIAYAYLKAHWETIAKVAPVAALAIAGAWALYLFLASGSAMKVVEVHVTAETHPYKKGQHLLIVDVTATNVGKMPVKLSEKGLIITIFQLPQDHPLGAIEPDEASGVAQLVTKPVGEYPPTPVGYKHHWVGAFVVRSDRFYVAAVRLWITDRMWMGSSAMARPVKADVDSESNDGD
ncbi:hypothetical protein BSFA1_41950 [Burkholderia sp. SFA1]|nr:hypothetical protein BSFA1_41950 [Burkholderia sp. SFA1]